MHSSKEYGKYLQEVREKKGISLQQVYNDTKITTNIISALESMEKDVLPSETYRIGLLKLYAKYLSIDETEIVKMIKANDLQEQPIEFDLINLETSKKKKREKVIWYLLGLLVIIVVALFFILRLNTIVNDKIVELRNNREEERSASLDNLERIMGFYEANFDLDTKLILVSGNEQSVIEISSIDPPQITIDEDIIDLEINVPHSIVLSDSSSPDYILLMRSVNTLKKQLQLRFDPQVENSGNLVSDELPIDNKDIEPDGKIINILTSPAILPIQVTLEFTNPTYYKITSDSTVIKAANVNKGFQDIISSEEPIQIYVTNSSFLNVKINNKDVTIPSTGLPYVFRVAWTEETSGTYTLRVIPLP